MANVTLTINEISLYDTQSAIIYIIDVLTWYAIGFGLILTDYISYIVYFENHSMI
jgi:hypothetical protein